MDQRIECGTDAEQACQAECYPREVISRYRPGLGLVGVEAADRVDPEPVGNAILYRGESGFRRGSCAPLPKPHGVRDRGEDCSGHRDHGGNGVVFPVYRLT